MSATWIFGVVIKRNLPHLKITLCIGFSIELRIASHLHPIELERYTRVRVICLLLSSLADLATPTIVNRDVRRATTPHSQLTGKLVTGSTMSET